MTDELKKIRDAAADEHFNNECDVHADDADLSYKSFVAGFDKALELRDSLGEPAQAGAELVFNMAAAWAASHSYDNPWASEIFIDGASWQYSILSDRVRAAEADKQLEHERRMEVEGQLEAANELLDESERCAELEASTRIISRLLNDAHAESNRLREALEFYASLETYAGELTEDVSAFEDIDCPIDVDMGEKARLALRAKPEGDD